MICFVVSLRGKIRKLFYGFLWRESIEGIYLGIRAADVSSRFRSFNGKLDNGISFRGVFEDIT